MTDLEMIEASRQFVLALQAICDRSNLSPDDRVALASMALPEFIAQQVGGFAAVDQLRNVADLMERQVLDEARAKH